MLDPTKYQNLTGLTLREVICELSALPEGVMDKPFHVCGDTTVYLHVSKDGDDGDYEGVSLDNDPLDMEYSERGVDDCSAQWS